MAVSTLIKTTLLALVSAVTADSLTEVPDVMTVHLTFKCNLYETYTVTVWLFELDDIYNDWGEAHTIKCEKRKCIGEASFSQTSDKLSSEYEVGLHLEHDCTGNRKKATFVSNQADMNGFWIVPIGLSWEENWTHILW